MLRELIKWSDDQLEKAYDEPTPKGCARACMAGAVEGWFEGVAIGGTVVVIVAAVRGIFTKKK